MPETGWQHSRGIDGRNPLDWVATFPWITWQHSRGLGGRNPWNTQLEEERAPLFSRKNLAVKGDIAQADVAQLITLFEHGKTFGSLIRVPEHLAEKLPGIAKRVQDVLVNGGM